MSNMKISSPGDRKNPSGPEQVRELAPASVFSFACHAGVPCFNLKKSLALLTAYFTGGYGDGNGRAKGTGGDHAA